MNWIPLNSKSQLDEIANNAGQACIIFKHSTRCSVSSMAKRSIEFGADSIPSDIPVYYLDLISYRDISSAVSERWQVIHESPQILLVQGPACLYHASHGAIDMDELAKHLP